MTTDKLKVGIISAGMIAKDGHIPAYRLFPERVSIEAICDVQADRAQQVASENEIPHWFDSAEKMFSSCDLDLVSICVPNCMHASAVEMALDAGAHVLCEKPLALTYHEANALYTKAEQKKLMLEACQTLRFNAEYMAAREYAVAGELGTLTFGDCACIRRRGVPMRGSFLQSSLNGGGAFADIGVHFIDAILWMMGCPRVISVTGMKSANIIHKERGVTYSSRESGAYGNSSVTMDSDPDACDVEEFASGVIRLEGNIGINFSIAWAANIPAMRRITILGDSKGLTLPDLTIYGTEDHQMVDLRPKIAPLGKYEGLPFPGHCYLIENALDHLIKGTPLAVSSEETLNVTAALELFYRSCAENKEQFSSIL